MVRLYLFAEGKTEETFADELLKKHLATYQVFLEGTIETSHAKRKGKIHRGGASKYQPIRNDIMRLLKQEKSSDVFFTTMIDLYAISRQFPGLKESERMRQNPLQRVEFLEKCFADDIGDHRFIPYIQLHEYEAYLFSEPSWFEYFYPESKAEIKALNNIADNYDTPELINDGQQTAPSKRIMTQFPDYPKSTYGYQLAQLIGLQVIRSKCPHFNAWLSRLESLAGKNISDFSG